MGIIIIEYPLISGIIILLLGRYIGYKGAKIIGIQSIIIGIIGIIYYLIGYIRNNKVWIIELGNWFNIEGINIGYNIIIDKYGILMITLVSIFTGIILKYAYWYLEEDEHIIRFIGLILIFAASMNILVAANNWLIIFMGWETVGLMSFFLINYWRNSINNIKSSMKAILYNKIGDIILIGGIILLIINNSSLEFYSMKIESNNKLIFIGLFIATIIKSAQFLSHPWLSDAMAGPTPVSALLHAATMVTAGIFLWIRIGDIIEINIIRELFIGLLLIGLITIIFSGISAYNQYDIKKLIAYSTSSHLGFMFISLFFIQGIGSISLYHLFNHALFKALLFLSSGLLIHLFSSLYPISPNQDIRLYNNISNISPYYSIIILISSLSLIGFPSFSGYYSKDKILFSGYITNITTLCNNNFPLIILIIGGILSIFYSFKLFYSMINKPESSLFNPSLFTSNSTSYYYNIGTSYLSFFFFLSIFFGYSLYPIFLTPLENWNTLEVLLNYNNTSSILNYFITYHRGLGLYLILIFPIVLLIINTILKLFKGIGLYYFIINIFKSRFYLDYLNTYLLYYPFMSLSYFVLYKSIDRGILEFIGPVGLFRLINSIFKINKSYSINPSLILYWFRSIFILLFISLIIYSLNPYIPLILN